MKHRYAFIEIEQTKLKKITIETKRANEYRTEISVKSIEIQSHSWSYDLTIIISFHIYTIVHKIIFIHFLIRNFYFICDCRYCEC